MSKNSLSKQKLGWGRGTIILKQRGKTFMEVRDLKKKNTTIILSIRKSAGEFSVTSVCLLTYVCILKGITAIIATIIKYFLVICVLVHCTI